MRRHPGPLLAAALLGLVLPSAARAERMYDVEVERLIEYANRGVKDFQKAARSDFKNAKMTVAGAEVDVGNYLKDMVEAGKKLRSRYDSNYAAVPEATDFLKRVKAADEFAAQNPGISGAKNEWELLRPNVTALARAYGIDFSTDASTWQPARAPDGPLREAARRLAADSKLFGKDLAEAAKRANMDKSRRKVLEGESELAEKAARDLEKTIADGRAAEPAMQSFNSALSDLGSRIQNEGLQSAVSPGWNNLQENARKVSELIGE